MKPRTLTLAALAVMGTFQGVPAFAAHYTVGSSPNGTAHIYADFEIALPDQTTLYCDPFYFTVTVVNGVAEITSAVSGDFPICREAETDESLPWTFQPPVSDAGPANVKISGISLRFPLTGAICTGDITATLDNNGKLSFDSPLGACRIRTVAPHWDSSPALDAVYP